MQRLLQASILLISAVTCTSPQDVTLVENGTAQAVLVLAEEPAEEAVYSAEELRKHVKLATGVELDIVKESALPSGYPSKVYLGETESAHSQGIIPEELVREEFIIRTRDRDLYVLGKNDLSPAPSNGTLFGVYEILHRYLGVRWLWPGELGTYVPETNTLIIKGPLEERHPPKFKFRRFRWHSMQRAANLAESGTYPAGNNHPYHENLNQQYYPEVEGLSFSAPLIMAYRDDLGVFFRRHKLDYTGEKPPVGHYFHSWWERYGQEHPEWFCMSSDGKRGPGTNASAREQQRVSMCVSNPQLHRHIVDEAWDGGSYLSLGEVDRRIFCQCENCLAWDGPQPEPDDYPRAVSADYNPQVVSDRYARFWKIIWDLARERNPDVTITTFLYWNYFPAPLGDIELGDYIYGEFVPWTGPGAYYPMPDDIDEWLREQWMGWKDRGIKLAYRPNNFHGGYVMPHISTHQAGNFFKFAYNNGMVGYDFDSFFSHWATKGPMLYMYMRMAWNPDQNIDNILQEYYSAFGPAAEQVEKYFNYWEEYSYERPGGKLYNPVRANTAYPVSVLDKGKEMLDEALEVASKNTSGEFAERVKFLQAGLEHAKLSSIFMGKATSIDSPEGKRAAQKALQKLIEFRREHEHLYISDFLNAASRETRRVDFNTLLN